MTQIKAWSMTINQCSISPSPTPPSPPPAPPRPASPEVEFHSTPLRFDPKRSEAGRSRPRQISISILFRYILLFMIVTFIASNLVMCTAVTGSIRGSTNYGACTQVTGSINREIYMACKRWHFSVSFMEARRAVSSVFLALVKEILSFSLLQVQKWAHLSDSNRPFECWLNAFV